MSPKLKKYGLMIVAAVLLIATAFAGAASADADIPIDTAEELKDGLNNMADGTVRGLDLPTGSLFVNISNTNNNSVTLILYTMDESNITTNALSTWVTNFTFNNLDDGVYTLFGYYMNGYVPTGVIKMVTLSDGFGYADLGFPQQNISSGINTSAEPGASTPHVSVNGLDTIVRAEPAPADKVIIFRFDAKCEVYNASNTNQSKLRTEILANTPNAEITYLNFTIKKLTYNFTTGALESVDVIDNPANLMTIYMEYDMTNRQNIQVWRIHNGPAEQLQELASGEIPSDGTYKLDGTNGVFIYAKHFSSYTISSTASSTTQPTQQSPAPFLGIIAGLGAATVLMRMRK